MTKDFNTEAARAAIIKQHDRIKQDLTDLVAFNSVYVAPESTGDHAAAANWVEQALREVGLETNRYVTNDGSPTFIGTRTAAPGKPTILLYSHYDVVPAGDHAQWTTDPFTLDERDGRWYGRGTADCKGNLVMHLAALRAVEELGGTELGLRVVVEGSEEVGGAGLADLIRTRPELFTADVIFIADCGNVAVGQPTLTTILRGGAQLTVQVDTLAAPIHSGEFGGPAPDAVAALARLLDSLRDEHGRTVIDGMNCTAKWEGVPYETEHFRKDAGVLDGVSLMGAPTDTPADLAWARPAVTITGFSATPVEKAFNVVQPTASAALNLRIPPGMVPKECAELLKAHLLNHAPWGAKVTVKIDEDDLYWPFKTDSNGPALQALLQALSAAYSGTPAASCGNGASIPLCAVLREVLPNAEIALFGIEEPLCTIHSADESVSPDELRDIAIAETIFLLTYNK